MLTFSDDVSVSEVHEIYFDGGSVAEKRGGLVKKRILRTGQWDVTPTPSGTIRRPLRIVRDGASSREGNVISLNELKRNFDQRVIPNVQIPLSDDSNDHKNLTRLNTGFVRELFVEDEGDVAYLTALMEFTEDEVADKVLSGTFADCSSGIPFDVVRKGQKYNAALEHVCITNQPFIDGLGGYIAASETALEEGVEVVHHVLNEEPAAPVVEEKKDEPVEPPKPVLTWLAARDSAAWLLKEHGYNDSFQVFDYDGANVFVKHIFTGEQWQVPLDIGGTQEAPSVGIPREVNDWVQIQGVQAKPAPQPVSGQAPYSSDPELAAAQRLREARLSLPTHRAGGA
jgi:hypothetical protein